MPSARVFAEHDPAAAAWLGGCRQRRLCPNPDLASAGCVAELLDAVGVHPLGVALVLRRPLQDRVRHGSTSGTPQSSKPPVSRVTTPAPLARATAAIIRSSGAVGVRPFGARQKCPRRLLLPPRRTGARA